MAANGNTYTRWAIETRLHESFTVFTMRAVEEAAGSGRLYRLPLLPSTTYKYHVRLARYVRGV